MKQQQIGQVLSIFDSELSPLSDRTTEVVLFGGGFGESILIKSDANSFVVVDSYINQESGNPIALDYLDCLKVPHESIKCIVVSHFHDDHIRGMSRILEATRYKAKVVFNPIMKHAHFIQCIAKEAVMEDCGGRTKEIVSLFNSMKENGLIPEWAVRDRLLYRDKDSLGFDIVSLTPSDAELEMFAKQLSSSAVDIGEYIKNENKYSLALLVNTQEARILLGGDLENRQNGAWDSLCVSFPEMGYKNASMFKVPHHGSATAQNERVWSTMLTESPIAFTTVFNRGRKVPNDEEIAWITSRSNRFYLAGKIEESIDLKKLMAKTMPGINVFVKEGKNGLLRIISGSTLRVESAGNVLEFQG